jgi:hypothetical protein
VRERALAVPSTHLCSRKPTNCPAETGEASALCAHLATMALREQRMVRWDARAGKPV